MGICLVVVVLLMGVTGKSAVAVLLGTSARRAASAVLQCSGVFVAREPRCLVLGSI